MTKSSYFFDGMKAVDMNDPALWTIAGGAGDAEEIEQYYRAVPWLWRGVDLRANAVASLPFAIVNEKGDEIDNSDDYQDALGFLPNITDLLFMTEASLTLLGRSYLYRLYNKVVTKGLKFVLAQSIDPEIDEKLGLTGFKRRLGTQVLDWPVEDVIYFWGRDPFVEVGPPREDKCPGQAALVAAGVLHNLGKYASAYFKRGAVRPMVVTLPSLPPSQEVSRLKSWLRRVFLGVDNAFTTQLFEEGTKFETIGDGIGELSSSNLTTEQREDISVALGIPMSIMWSTEAGGLGGGGVVASDERKLYEQTIVPEAKFLAGKLNEQLLRKTGHRLVFRPERLDVFQTDENQRSQSFERYVNTGIRLSVAAQMLGLELPEGIDYDDLDTMKEEDKEAAAERMPDFGGGQNPQNPQQNPQQQAMRADLRRWRTKASKAGGVVPFESEFIPPALMESINGAIKEYGVEEAFAFLKKKN